MLSWALRHGLPVHQAVPTGTEATFASLDRAERRALDVLWSFAQSTARQAYSDLATPGAGTPGGWKPGPMKLSWPSPTSFTSLFSRLADRGHVAETKRLAHFDYLDLAGQGVTELSYGSVLFREKDPMVWNRLSLRGAAACGAPFYRAILREASLGASDLSGCILRGADLERADLAFANLTAATLVGADFRRASLHGASLSDAQLWGATFQRANLSRAVLDRAHFHPSDSTESQHEVRPTNLVGADLSGAQARECDFGRSDLRGANLAGADLSDADISLARVNRIDLREAKMTRTRVAEAQLPGMKLSEGQLREVVVCNAEAVEARRADLLSKMDDPPARRAP